jgi:hypothetical protein
MLLWREDYNIFKYFSNATNRSSPPLLTKAQASAGDTFALAAQTITPVKNRMEPITMAVRSQRDLITMVA